jgi:serine protease Do
MVDKITRTFWVINAVVILALAAGLWYEYKKVDALTNSVSTLEAALSNFDSMASTAATSTESTVQTTVGEVVRRDQVAQKSESQSLQDAVARATPAVVSIVESKVVPKLQITYENPFGSDPSFRGFGIQVPVYRQVGTTTRQIAAGTGFLVRSNGYIVTNKHVVADTGVTYTVLLSTGAQKVGTVVWRSPSEDLAIVRIAGTGYPSIPLGDSSSLHLAQSVFAIGNALGQYNNSVSVGVISGLNRTVTARDELGRIEETLQGVIQTDAAINPGNSGGPLVNLAGQAVGINVAVVAGSQNISFALPINEIRSVLARLGI